MFTREKMLEIGRTLAVVFLSSALAAFIGLGVNIFDIGVEGWKGIVGAGVAAVAVAAFNWLNPKDHRYGVDSDKDSNVA